MNPKEIEAEAVSLDARWRKVCSETLTFVARNRDAWIFKEPVIESNELSHEAKVAYSLAIPEPMDFRTIRKNFSSFSSPMDFERDMLLVFKNCATFNKPGQDAFEMGKDVENVFLTRWEFERRKEIAISLFDRSVELAASIDKTDALITSRRSKLQPPHYDAETRKVVEGGGGGWSSSVSGSGSGSGSQSPANWKEIISVIFSQIVKDPQMHWFMRPVHSFGDLSIDIKHSYYAVIKAPMDLSTVGKNLSIYPSPLEFRKDLELIVTNSLRFNPPQSPVNLAALELQRIVTSHFDEVYKFEFSKINNASEGWKGVKKIFPDPPPPECLPPAPAVLRLKRSRTNDDSLAPVPSQAPSGAVAPEVAKSPVKSISTSSSSLSTSGFNVLKLNRAMSPLAVGAETPQDWKVFATHCLSELNQIKDESSNNRITWIFQRPLFKYDLPVSIKRLYLLSITNLVDLSLINDKLNFGMYDRGNGPADFEADMTTMIDNCLVFNDESQYPHKVGHVLKKHFEQYWIKNGLREMANASFSPSREHAENPLAGAVASEQPNWDEIRTQVIPDVVRPNFDRDSVSGSFPLNDELLYEWRVSQRFVMQQLRNQLVHSQNN